MVWYLDLNGKQKLLYDSYFPFPNAHTREKIHNFVSITKMSEIYSRNCASLPPLFVSLICFSAVSGILL